MAVKSLAQFGWTLADIFNAKASRLDQLRCNVLPGDSRDHSPEGERLSAAVSHWTSDVNLLHGQASSFRRRARRMSQGSSVDSGCRSEDTCSIASEGCPTPDPSRAQCPKATVWNLGGQDEALSIALTTVESNQYEINSVLHELREIRDDFTLMNDRMNRATDNLRQVKQLTSCGHQRPRRAGPAVSSEVRGPCPGPATKRKSEQFDEDEMVDITHRVLKRVCHLSLAKAEGHVDVSLLV